MIAQPDTLSLPSRVEDYRQRIETVLDQLLPPASQPPQNLHQAMRYAVLGGGKRIRPLLCYAAGELLDIPLDHIDSLAAAVEMIHVYSLIHDDMPAMDDDDLRRGKATVHIAFDEATAILAGDGLQALAFEVISSDQHLNDYATGRIRALQCLAQAIGSAGMVGGQALDMEGEQRQLSVDEVERMFLLKTGELLRASVLMPCLLLHPTDATITQTLERVMHCLGLAFQIRDDIIDIEGDTTLIGKPQGSDADRGKSTYPGLVGLEQAKNTADALYQEALELLDSLGDSAKLLAAIGQYIVERKY